MRKNFMLLSIIFVLFIVGIVISACSVNEAPGPEQIVCEAPYIRVGAGCCLDSNANKICDSDEPKESPEPEVIEEPEVPVVEKPSCDDYVIENVCALTDAIVYTIKIGDADIERFNVEIIHNDPTQNTTSRSVRRSASTEYNVTGGKANSRIKGQLRPNPYIFSEAIFTSIPCGLEKKSGPGFPDPLPAC